ncbi:Set3 complex subunit, partial [Ascosphaera aggregata]
GSGASVKRNQERESVPAIPSTSTTTVISLQKPTNSVSASTDNSIETPTTATAATTTAAIFSSSSSSTTSHSSSLLSSSSTSSSNPRKRHRELENESHLIQSTRGDADREYNHHRHQNHHHRNINPSSSSSFQQPSHQEQIHPDSNILHPQEQPQHPCDNHQLPHSNQSSRSNTLSKTAATSTSSLKKISLNSSTTNHSSTTSTQYLNSASGTDKVRPSQSQSQSQQQQQQQQQQKQQSEFLHPAKKRGTSTVESVNIHSENEHHHHRSQSQSRSSQRQELPPPPQPIYPSQQPSSSSSHRRSHQRTESAYSRPTQPLSPKRRAGHSRSSSLVTLGVSKSRRGGASSTTSQHRLSVERDSRSPSVSASSYHPSSSSTTTTTSAAATATKDKFRKPARLTDPTHSASPARQMPKRRRDQNGRTPLARACAAQEFEAAKAYYHEVPDDLDIADNAGNTPLQIASLEGCADIVEFLISCGCLIDTRNIDKDTPLIDAVENGHLNVVKLLLDAGANPRAGNAQGDEPYDLVPSDSENYEEIKKVIANAKAKSRRRKSVDERGRSVPANGGGVGSSDLSGSGGAAGNAGKGSPPPLSLSGSGGGNAGIGGTAAVAAAGGGGSGGEGGGGGGAGGGGTAAGAASAGTSGHSSKRHGRSPAAISHSSTSSNGQHKIRRTVRSETTRNDLLWTKPTMENLRDFAAKGDMEGAATILNVLQKADTDSLIAAAKGGHDEVLGLLLGMGEPDPDPDPVPTHREGYNTPMLAAIGRGNDKVIRLLLDQKGFNPTRRIYNGYAYHELAKQRKGDQWEVEYEMLKEAYDDYVPTPEQSQEGKRGGRSSPVKRGGGKEKERRTRRGAAAAAASATTEESDRDI